MRISEVTPEKENPAFCPDCKEPWEDCACEEEEEEEEEESE